MNGAISKSMATLASLVLDGPPTPLANGAVDSEIIAAIKKASNGENLLAAIKSMKAKSWLEQTVKVAKDAADASIKIVDEPISDVNVDISVVLTLLNTLRGLRAEHRSLVMSLYAAEDSEADLAREIAFRSSSERSKYVARTAENAKVRLTSSRDQLAFLERQVKQSKKLLEDHTDPDRPLDEARVAWDVAWNSLSSEEPAASNWVAAASETPEGKALDIQALGDRRTIAAFGQAYLYYLGAQRGVSSLRSQVLAVSAAKEQAVQSMKTAEAYIEALTQQAREDDRALQQLQTTFERAKSRKSSLTTNFSLRIESLLLEYSSAALALETSSRRLQTCLSHIGIAYSPFVAAPLLDPQENDEKLIADQFAQLSRTSERLLTRAPLFRTIKLSIALPALQWGAVLEFPAERRVQLKLAFDEFGPAVVLAAWLKSPDATYAAAAVRSRHTEFLVDKLSYSWLPLVCTENSATVSLSTPGVDSLRGTTLPTVMTLNVTFYRTPTEGSQLELVLRCYGG